MSDEHYPKLAYLVTPTKRVGFKFKMVSMVKTALAKKSVKNWETEVIGVIDQNEWDLNYFKIIFHAFKFCAHMNFF